MGIGQLDFLYISAGVILLVVLLTPVVFYVLVRYWQQKIQQDLKGLRADLRQLYSRRKEVASQAQAYSPGDPEPFGSHAAKLEEQLGGIDSAAAEVELENVRMQERFRRLSSNLWSKTVGKPYGWYSLWKTVVAERRGLEGLRSDLAETEGQVQAISRLSWDAARQARDARASLQIAEQKLADLRSKNLRGATLDAAAAQVEQCQEALESLPVLLYEGEETAVIVGIEKEAVAGAFETLGETQPILVRLIEKLKEWEKGQVLAEGKAAAMRQALAGAEQALAGAPPALNLVTLQSEFQELQNVSNNLHASLSRLDVESLGKVTEEAGRVQSAAQVVDGQIKAARGQLTQLEATLAELSEGLKSTSARFSFLGSRETYPIAWGQSRARLTQLSRQSSSLGAAKKPRTLEALEGDLKQALQLNEQHKELARHSEALSRQHAELLQLLEGNLKDAARWRQGTRKLLEGVQLYDPENWPKADAIGTLPEELNALDDGLQMLVSGSAEEAIPEDELSERLENTRQLAQFYERLRGRVERAGARLQEIQSNEETARAQLEGARNTFNQSALLVRSNPYLAETAAQDIGRLQGVLQSALDEFSRRESGSVEKKVKHVSAVVARVETALNNWVETLTKDIQAQMDELSNGLAQLEAAVLLDEPAIGEARRLLAAGQPYRSGGKSHFRLEAIVLELKQRSDFWHSCESTLRSLEDVVQPVMENYEAANESRKDAKEQFEEILSWIRSTRAWPPVATTLESERQEFERVEAQWTAIRQQRLKAIALVSQLGSMSAKYQSVLEKARQSAAQAAHEQEQVEKIEAELDELVQLWQNQWRAHQDNPLVTEEIRRLLNEMDAEIDKIRQEYRRGNKNYTQVLQALQSLRRKARIHQAPIDDHHVVDVNGRVIPFG